MVFGGDFGVVNKDSWMPLELFDEFGRDVDFILPVLGTVQCRADDNKSFSICCFLCEIRTPGPPKQRQEFYDLTMVFRCSETDINVKTVQWLVYGADDLVSNPSSVNKFSLLQNIHIDTGTHPASYYMVIGFLSWGTAAGAWSWPFSSVWRQD